MILAWLLLLTGLTISAVAIYYSVIGLAAIFAAATIPIYIMGGSLEVAKLVCASWLKANWDKTPGFMKLYMTTAVVVLMFITSMGIFGFLSKAHTDQSLVSGDVISKIAVYDEKIKTEKENIDAARKSLKQMDEAVDQVMSRSNDERGADKATQIRRAQQRERAQLQRDINNAQSNIAKLQAERSPIAAEVRKVEAEVGPIKYIAKLIYGDDPDTNLLEKAVTWVIILIVAVFDPLAVIMLLAAQMTFQWLREQKQQDSTVLPVGEEPTKEDLDDDGIKEPCPKCGTSMLDAPGIGVYCPNKECDVLDGPKSYIAEKEDKDAVWPFPTYDEITPKEESKSHHPDTHPYLKQGFAYPADWVFHPPMVSKEPEVSTPTVDSTEIKIDEVKDNTFQILPELEEESKKKVYDQGEGPTDSQDQALNYIQNGEQNEETLWQRLQKKKDQMRPKDRLYKEYSDHEFKNITVDKELEPELYEFVEETKNKGTKFSNYDNDKLEYFARRIYELRKD
jgi:hypothetical protein